MKNFFRDNIWGKGKEKEEDVIYYDSYTNLGNMNLLKKSFEEREKGKSQVLVIIELNKFINMTTIFDYDIIESAVSLIAEKLTRFAQETEGIAFRFQMNKFAVMAPYIVRERFMNLLKVHLGDMERVHLQDEHITYHHHFTFTYLAYFMGAEDTYLPEAAKLINNMEIHMKRISKMKETSGGIYNDIGMPDWEFQKALMEEVKKGWEEKQFVPYYQLIYDVKTKRAIGAELLTRWLHPERGLIFPGDFLPVLESKGLIIELDLYMLEEACKKIKGWVDDEVVSVPITINFSKLNIHRQNFVERVIQIVEKYDIPPAFITLEMEEGAILFEMDEHFLGVVNRLHDFGFSLSMDRFAASEYSSINLLRVMPVDMIKLNPKFFPQKDATNRDKIFVMDVFRMAKDLGIKAVAENVETEEDVERLTKYGCEMAQGFFFSKPMSNEEFEKVIF